jgi:hypothetical protein
VIINIHHIIGNWHKSLKTHHEENACVEVGRSGNTVGIRDTKQAGMPVDTRPGLSTSPATFGEFARAIVAA